MVEVAKGTGNERSRRESFHTTDVLGGDLGSWKITWRTIGEQSRGTKEDMYQNPQASGDWDEQGHRHGREGHKVN